MERQYYSTKDETVWFLIYKLWDGSGYRINQAESKSDLCLGAGYKGGFTYGYLRDAKDDVQIQIDRLEK